MRWVEGCGSLREGFCWEWGWWSSLSLSRSRALFLCSASSASKRFLRPGTALRWLKECVLHVSDLVHGFRVVISTTPQWISGLNSRSVSFLLRWRLLLTWLLLSCFFSERWPLPLGIWPGIINEGFGMEGQLRPGLRAEDEDEEDVVMAVVLLLTVVLAEDVDEDEVVARADGVCTSLADGSTRRCIFSTLTAGVRIFSGWIIRKGGKGGLRWMPDIFSLAGLRSLGLEEAEDIEEEDKLDPMVEGRLRRPPPATAAPVPSPGPRLLPLLRFLPDIGKGIVEAGLLSELCLLS